ncbi:MAG: hypothetical protein KAS32_27520 [Candidatus Peribacteraceae bacterium]|nr:hypothetical protein [Candidatus Peribacteraceae bacterium]
MEQRQRQLVVKALNTHKVHAISVENSAYPGTPDVSYIGGWIELKYAKTWPVRKDTALRLPHFTPQQRVWLTEHWVSGGAAWLCVEVSKTRDWLVFDGISARHVGRDGYHKEALFNLASFAGKSAGDAVNYILGLDNAHFTRLPK